MLKGPRPQGVPELKKHLQIAFSQTNSYDPNGWNLSETNDEYEKELLSDLYTFILLFPKILKSNEDTFRVARLPEGVSGIGFRSEGKFLLAAIKRAEEIALHFSSHQRNPRFELLWKCMQEADVCNLDTYAVGS